MIAIDAKDTIFRLTYNGKSNYMNIFSGVKKRCRGRWLQEAREPSLETIAIYRGEKIQRAGII